MAEMITRCPQCGTAFRITPAHLRSAKGSVRCGSCLNVFNARDHLTPESRELLAQAEVQSAPAAEAPPQPTPREPSHSASDKEADAAAAQPELTPEESSATADPSDTDDFLISDDMENDLDGDELFSADSEEDVYVETASATQTSLFERFATNDEQDEEEAADDESWALKLLDEEDPTPVPGPGEWISPSSSETDAIDAEGDLPEHDPWDQALVRADEADRDYTAGLMTDPESTWYEHAAPATSGLESAEDEDYVRGTSITAGRRDTAGNAYLDAIEPEPVEFSYREKRPFWQSRWVWGALSIVAALALFAQIAWMQYPALNRTEPYRSFYQAACTLLGCQLPPQIDPSAIRTSNLVVRSHPDQDDALMVDVVMQNTASFQQPFPMLQLTFTDLQGNVVAQRQFTPEDYLGGELTGQTAMPVRQPVHIAMEIVDPGPRAVNYRVNIVADR